MPGRKPGRVPKRKTNAGRRAPERRAERRKRAEVRLRREKGSDGSRGYARAIRERTEVGEAPFPLPEGWHLDRPGTSISLSFTTRDFLEAVDLLQAVADIAEQEEHHPDVHITEYNHVGITTYSHDVGHLTERDERLAERLTNLLRERGFLPLRGKPGTKARTAGRWSAGSGR
jgi:pterin-4a-carbinolamine dehydratase